MLRATAIFLSLVLLLLVSSARAAPHPNVIIFLADDLGWADVGFHGQQHIETPTLDRIAKEGVQLDRFYTTPICSPTRAALMTGRDPIRLGVVYAVILPWSNNGIHPDEHFMPESFQAAGYQTAMVGKWHLGHAQQTYHPNQRGFDHFYGHLHTEVGYFPPFGNQGGKDFQKNGVSIDDQGYETFLLADEASRWIKARDKERPFFLYMPFIAPHTPLEAPEDLKEKYADIPTDLAPARARPRIARARSRRCCACRVRAPCTPRWSMPWIRRSAACSTRSTRKTSRTKPSCSSSATTAEPPTRWAVPTTHPSAVARAIPSRAASGWCRPCAGRARSRPARSSRAS
jgi:arylsulfatase A-like enzyme